MAEANHLLDRKCKATLIQVECHPVETQEWVELDHLAQATRSDQYRVCHLEVHRLLAHYLVTLGQASQVTLSPLNSSEMHMDRSTNNESNLFDNYRSIVYIDLFLYTKSFIFSPFLPKH